MSTATLDRHTASIDDVGHIAALLVNIRPDWDPGLVRVVLLSHRDQVDGADLAVAAIKAARNLQFRTPKSIGWRGPHWSGLDTQPIQVRRDRRLCGICGKPEHRCYGERRGPDDHDFEEPRR